MLKPARTSPLARLRTPVLTLACSGALASSLAGCQSQASRASGEPTLSIPGHNVWIPPRDAWMHRIEVAAVYNDTHIQIRVRVPTEAPSWYHQYRVYENGEWVMYGSSPVGPDEHGLYEDRIAMMLDDQSVRGFETYGGYVTMHPGVRTRTDEVPTEQAAAHPWIGRELGETDVRKFIPQSRESDASANGTFWARVRDGRELEELAEQGVFIDSWQWRAHRSNPLGWADNGYVLEYRKASEGRAMYTTNWDDERDQPRWMYDPQVVGFAALDRERLFARAYGQGDLYYLAEGFAKPFDPEHDWQEGDVLPQRLLQRPDGSRGAIRASGEHRDGAWHVTMTRSLEPVNSTDSKRLVDGGLYHVAFATHLRATGGRWHYVTLPITLGLNVDATLRAVRIPGARDLRDVEASYIELPMFYPGQVTFAQVQDASLPVHHVYMRARQQPHSAAAVESLVQAIIDQERVDLREMGIDW